MCLLTEVSAAEVQSQAVHFRHIPADRAEPAMVKFARGARFRRGTIDSADMYTIRLIRYRTYGIVASNP